MFAKKQRAPANPTKAIIPTWALQRWGVDIVGPLLTAPGNLHFAAVALDYFTKWIKAKALAKITSGTLISFLWQQIIYRFGLPSYITVDNGKQFDCVEFRSFYRELGIKLGFASVNHPESNGAVERANGLILVQYRKRCSICQRENGRRNWLHQFGATTSRALELQGSPHFVSCMAKKPSHQKSSS